MTEENEIPISEIPESYQRYLDEIYDISRKRKGGWVSNKDISESLGVEPASVTGMLEKLKTAEYIKWEPRKKIRLTKEGKRIAKQLGESHNLLTLFFKNVLKITDEKIVEKLSCEIEHHLTKEVRNSLRNFLDNYLTEQDIS